MRSQREIYSYILLKAKNIFNEWISGAVVHRDGIFCKFEPELLRKILKKRHEFWFVYWLKRYFLNIFSDLGEFILHQFGGPQNLSTRLTAAAGLGERDENKIQKNLSRLTGESSKQSEVH